MIIRFYRVLFGFLKVRFYGENKEKFFSLCAKNGISMWNTRVSGENIISCISVRDFRNLRLIKPENSGVHILKRRGLPFVTERYKNRVGIPVGLILFFIILQLLSGYIWVIDINGNHKVSDSEIKAACQKIGITEGIAANSIYPKAKRESLLLELDEIAWAGINIEGSRLTVNVTEVKGKTEDKGFSNLKASCDGIIEKIDVISGTSVVKVGQAVKKGDLLVSGIIETADGTRFVNSKGTVTAKVKKELVLKEKFKQRAKIPTGKVKKKCVLEIFGLQIPLYLGGEKGEYAANKSKTQLSLFGSNLPIIIHKKEFSFFDSREVTYRYEDNVKRLEKRLQAECEKKGEYSVFEKEFSKTQEEVVLKAVIEGKENIEYSDILLINAGN